MILVEDWAEIRRLHRAEQMPIRAIARHLGISKNTVNKPFGRWGEVFGDETVAAAMIDRLVHHAEVHSLKGDSYRMRGRELGRVPTDTSDND